MTLDDEDAVRSRNIRPECSPPALQDFIFQVSPAFLSALDIRIVERVDKTATHLAKEKVRAEGTLDESQIKKTRRLKNVLTTGDPPLFSFKPYDMIHAHNERVTVQIHTATSDQIGSDDKIDGVVTFRLYADTAQQAFYTCTQTEFVELLRSGCCLHLGIDVRYIPS